MFVESQTRQIVFQGSKTWKSSFDALDGLYGADRWGVIGAIVNNSFQKGHLQAKQLSRKLSPSKMFKHRPHICWTISKLNQNRLKHLKKNKIDPSPQKIHPLYAFSLALCLVAYDSVAFLGLVQIARYYSSEDVVSMAASALTDTFT